MEKNSNIGLALIFGILVFFWWFNQPNQKEIEQRRRYFDSLEQVRQAQADSVENAVSQAAMASDTATLNGDSARMAALKQKFGLLSTSVSGSAKSTILENGLIRVELTNLGGQIDNAEIKEYKSYGDKPLRIYSDDEQKKFGFAFVHNNRSYMTSELYFEPSEISIDKDSTQQISYTLPMGDGRLVYKYSLAANSYEVGLQIEAYNLQDKLTTQTNNIVLEWSATIPAQEKGKKSEGMWSNLCYRYADGDVEQMDATGKDSETENMTLEWVAYKNQFFSAVFHAKDGFAGGTMESSAYDNRSENIKKLSSQLGVKFDFRTDSKAEFRFLFLPNYFYTLESYEGMQLTELLPLSWGIFRWINEYFIIPVFKYLETIFSNYGLIILILTLIIKALIFPLTFSSFKSQAKMRVLKPQIDAINEKIPADKPMERQQATMALYKKAGVNPMGGCLPMLLQMPILFAAFRFFPAAIELRGQSFLWADDLSTYDSILDLPFSIPFYGDHVSLFCLLMCLTQVIYTKFTMQSQNTAQMPGMSVMMYMMPVMLLFFFNDYPAGLCYYYFVSTLITVLQTVIIKHTIDDKAILAQIENNQKKPVKKSRFQEMYERKLKELEKQQRLQQKKK